MTSCEEFKQFYRVTAETFPDQQMTLDTLVAEGDRVAS
jgi:predicted ester cyclase